ncbi:hypothetical protein [Paenibacillus radicis (ex Gao et al. 2016)]|uniref:Major facilitator superfamily (MFS) profile domain-containing protein n=1 Tax=Paenibacillus radicis (ex Gao et al. 2016) TaxID=1737354 RepID=A0A917HT31_9BACL|nr:hypothetical protein [Paenibacillus radicis (ex Gao et al. 2016)]GGG88138.1 hypothetical protein GCM10010918_53250 [Paenibacillus radicis (ex Gao et al. 2016)]
MSKQKNQLRMTSGQRLMMMGIAMGAFLSHFTAGIVNVSLPLFAEIFDSRLEIVQWITTGYLLAIAILLPSLSSCH